MNEIMDRIYREKERGGRKLWVTSTGYRMRRRATKADKENKYNWVGMW